MKNLIYLSTIIIFSLALTSCCEEIKYKYGCTNKLADNYDPDATIENGSCTGAVGCTDSTASNYDPLAAVNCGCEYENVRRVLIEDFTGHRCINCPYGAEKVKELVCKYGNQIIPIAVHCTPLADPGPAPFDANYQTPVGDQLMTDFALIAIPTGAINRMDYNGYVVSDIPTWETRVQQELAKPLEATVAIENNYNSSSREVSIDLTITGVTNLSEGPYNIVVYIIEDKIQSAQVTPEGDDLEYIQSHVLRGAVNSTYGDELATSISIGETITKNYTYTLNNSWDEDNCIVVAFLSKASDNSVIQANEAHITH